MLPPLWSQIARAESIDTAILQLRADDPSLGPHDDELFLGEYVVHLDYVEGIRDLRECLEEIAPLDLSIAPVIVDSATDGHHRSALLCRYEACAGDDLVVLDEERPRRSLPADRVETYAADFRRMLDAGLDLEEATRGGLFYLLCGSRTRPLVLDGWNALVPFDSDYRREREAELEAQLRLLGSL